MNWNSDIREVKGIGEKTAKLFHKLNVFTVRDLIYYLPRDYEKFEEPLNVSQLKEADVVSVKAVIPFQTPQLKKAGRLTLYSFFLREGEKRIQVTFFNMPFLKSILVPGKEFVFRGRLDTKRGVLTLEQPQYYTPSEYEQYVHSLQPVYALTKGLSSKFIQKCVKEILANLSVPELLPLEFIEKYHLMEKVRALHLLHFPTSAQRVPEARKRLVFEEFLAFCIRVKKKKEQDLKLSFSPALLPSAAPRLLLEQLPYHLTAAQQRVWKELEEDLLKDVAMNRIIQGDVGSGKTILAILSLLLVAANNRQGALMAPTEVLAKQHFESIKELTEAYHLPMKPILLVGSMTAKQKKEAHKAIQTGMVNVIVGTHALIQDSVDYHNLALVITDEQHRFGVRQRQNLQEKGENTHVCVMSATPIPRTLAIVLFGDLNISILDEMPLGRLPIKNCVVNPSYRETAYRFMEKEIEKGHQIYCICPMVEEGEMEGLENVVEYSKKLSEHFSSRVTVEYLHGKMKPAMKNNIMEEFSSGTIDILVSTTVIEVGINVPNATVMLVENAERFGLAQLHQLRGRVGRGKEQSYCIFINGNENSKTRERLELLNKSNDGFFLANEDMRLRGPGDLFGIAQSGDFQFEIGDIYRDAELLMETACLADTLLQAKEPERLFPNILEFSLNTGRDVDFRSI